jgi:hypothetical protein
MRMNSPGAHVAGQRNEGIFTSNVVDLHFIDEREMMRATATEIISVLYIRKARY